MNWQNLVSSNIGLIHVIFSVIALILGTMVLFMPKGTTKHKKIGYYYCFSMIGINATAFMLYRLFGSFGIFHWMAVLSLATLLAGMLPMILKKPKAYISLHFNFMYWSVIGLYGALMAETLVRLPDIVIESGIPNTVFYNMTGIAVGVVMFTGAFFSIRNRKKWLKFDKSVNEQKS